MQPYSSFDRALVIAIAIGVVAILGFGWILLTGGPGELPLSPTAIPSSFSSLDAWTLTPPPPATLSQDETPPTTTSTRTPRPSLTPTSTHTPRPTATLTHTPDQIQPLRAGKYDDTDPNIAYDRYWTPLKNPGTKNAYKGTIHVSTGIGNEASFRFAGEGFRLGYQRGKNFGTVTVLIDDQSYSFHEQAFDLVWRSPQLSPGDHFVRIIHQSGESINLDYIEILD